MTAGDTDSQMRTLFGRHGEDRNRAGDAGGEGHLRGYLLEAKGGSLKGWGRSSMVECLPTIDGAWSLIHKRWGKKVQCCKTEIKE